MYAAAATPLVSPTVTMTAVPPAPNRRRRGRELTFRGRTARRGKPRRTAPRRRARSAWPGRAARGRVAVARGQVVGPGHHSPPRTASDPRVAGQRPQRPVHRDPYGARLLADQLGHRLHVQPGDHAQHHQLGLRRGQGATSSSAGAVASRSTTPCSALGSTGCSPADAGSATGTAGRAAPARAGSTARCRATVNSQPRNSATPPANP